MHILHLHLFECCGISVEDHRIIEAAAKKVTHRGFLTMWECLNLSNNNFSLKRGKGHRQAKDRDSASFSSKKQQVEKFINKVKELCDFNSLKLINHNITCVVGEEEEDNKPAIRIMKKKKLKSRIFSCTKIGCT